MENELIIEQLEQKIAEISATNESLKELNLAQREAFSQTLADLMKSKSVSKKATAKATTKTAKVVNGKSFSTEEIATIEKAILGKIEIRGDNHYTGEYKIPAGKRVVLLKNKYGGFVVFTLTGNDKLKVSPILKATKTGKLFAR